MLGQDKDGEHGNYRAEQAPSPNAEEMKALAADLPAELDARLKKLLDAAVKGCARSGFDAKRLLAALSTARYTDAEFQTVLEALNTARKGPTPEARMCAWMLGLAALTPEHHSLAVARLRILLGSAPGSLLMPGPLRMMRAALRTIPFSVALGLLASSPLWSNPDGLGVIAAILLSVMFSSILFLPSLCIVHEAERHAARQLRFLAAHALGRMGAAEAVDTLLAASLQQDAHLCNMARISLRVALPRLTSDHYGRLGPNAVQNLCRLLSLYAPAAADHKDAGHSFKIEMLDALEKVGDARAIATVRDVLSEWGPGRDRLYAAGDRVAVVLEERKRRETERATLLRGTGQPTIADDELLRASTNQAESKPEQLLRPIG